MASTYSDLKIELIGTGEQTGTWGTTTNNNFSVAVGEAITGSADVAFSSADVTVTLTDTNAAQTARNLRLNLTGTSGGARNLILGSGCQIEKLYLINNGLADAVTVKNTSGTGIVVPAGKTMFVYNNGTNVVDAITYLSAIGTGFFDAGTVSAPSITFTGDTNTGIFSPAADTIAFTEGGVESMRITSAGDVGIGTSSPSGRLHAATTTNTAIYGAADAGYSLFRGVTNSSGGVLSISGNSTGNGINFTVFNAALNGYEPANYDGSVQIFKTSTTERMRITSTGKVGIGVTPSAWDTSTNSSVLQVKNSSFFDFLGVQLDVGLNTYFDGSVYKRIITDEATRYVQGDGAHIWSTAASGSADSTITWSEQMRITAAGGVGIGTANPSAMLQVAGSSSVSALKIPNIEEVATISATAATGTIAYDITTQSVLYYTTNASGNFTVNFRGSSGTSLNTLMATGESMSVTFLVTNGATAYYNSAVQVDGNSVTPKWQGGTAPTAGNASSIDSYTYVIIKTGSATFTVLASITKFA